MKSLEQAAEQLLREDPEIAGAFARLQIGAASVVLLDDDGFVAVMASIGYPEGLIDAFRRFSVHEPLPLAEALRTGTAIWLASVEEHETRYPSSIATFTSNSERRGWASIPFLLAPETRCGLALSFLSTQVLSPAIRTETEALTEKLARRLQIALAE